MARLIVAAIFGIITAFLFEFGGVIEGRFYPVMGPLALSNPVETPEGDTLWSGRAPKLRGCSYVRTEWFLGPRNGRRVQVAVEYRDPPEVRGAGELSWTGILIDLPVRQVLRNSHADVIHKCPNRPWETRTHFYDSEVVE